MFSCHGSEAGNERSSVSTLGKSLHTGQLCMTPAEWIWTHELTKQKCSTHSRVREIEKVVSHQH